MQEKINELKREIGKTCRALPESCTPFPKECEQYLIPTTTKNLKADYSRTETDELGTEYLTQYADIIFHEDVDEASAKAVIERLVDELPATVAAYYSSLRNYTLDVGTDSLEALHTKLEFIRNFDPSIERVIDIPLDKPNAYLPDTEVEGYIYSSAITSGYTPPSR